MCQPGAAELGGGDDFISDPASDGSERHTRELGNVGGPEIFRAVSHDCCSEGWRAGAAVSRPISAPLGQHRERGIKSDSGEMQRLNFIDKRHSPVASRPFRSAHP